VAMLCKTKRGKFIMRQTDLSISEDGFEIPLTRTYTADDWVPPNKSHAFGVNASHPYDIASLGTRSPYASSSSYWRTASFCIFHGFQKALVTAMRFFVSRRWATVFTKRFSVGPGTAG
jgi:hypothetical protein